MSYPPLPHDPGEIPADGVNLKEVFAVLRQHLLLVLAVSFVVSGLAAGYFLTRTPTYTARGLIRLTNARTALTSRLENGPGENAVGPRVDVALSQIEVMRGRTVLGRVIDSESVLRLMPRNARLSLRRLTAVRVDSAVVADTLHLNLDRGDLSVRGHAGPVRATYGSPIELDGVQFVVAGPAEIGNADLVVMNRDAAIDALAGDVKATPRDLTDAIEVSYTSSDPHLAQRVVNTLIRIFRENDIEAARRQSRRRREFVEQQLRITDSLLSQSQLALSTFRSTRQIYSSKDKITAAQQGIISIDLQRGELDAERRMVESLLSDVEHAPAARKARTLQTLVSSTKLAADPGVLQLYSQLGQLESGRDSLISGPARRAMSDPDVVRQNVLIDGTLTKLTDAVRGYLASLAARLAGLDELRVRNAGDVRQLPALEANEVRLVQQVDAVSRIGDQLRDELQKARMAEAVEAGQVEIVYPASLPLEPVATHISSKISLALLLGLLLGGGAAFVREHMNTSVRRHEEVEQMLRVPSLAVIPRTYGWLVDGDVHDGTGLERRPLRLLGHEHRRRNGSPMISSDVTGYSAADEAYRILRTNLSFLRGGQPLRTLVVTSAFAGEGKTNVAANLAFSFAQLGQRVLLIDCDLHRGRLHEVFQVPRAPGFSEVLTGLAVPAEVVVRTSVAGISVLPAGSAMPNPGDPLASEHAEAVLNSMLPEFDLIVLDTPPVLTAADAAILGRMADGALLVVRAGRTERAAALRALEQLSLVNVRIVGAVLNDPDGNVASRGYYYGPTSATNR